MEEVKAHVHKEENQMFPRFRALAKRIQIERLSRELRVGKEADHKKAAA
jgi:hypothetical protein